MLNKNHHLIITITSNTITLSSHHQSYKTLKLENNEIINGIPFNLSHLTKIFNQFLKEHSLKCKTMTIHIDIDTIPPPITHHKLVLQYLILSTKIGPTLTEIYYTHENRQSENLLLLFTPSSKKLKRCATRGLFAIIILLVPLNWHYSLLVNEASKKQETLTLCQETIATLKQEKTELTEKDKKLAATGKKTKLFTRWHKSNLAFMKTLEAISQTIPNQASLETLDLQSTSTPNTQHISMMGQAESINDVAVFHHELSATLSGYSFLVTTSHKKGLPCNSKAISFTISTQPDRTN